MPSMMGELIDRLMTAGLIGANQLRGCSAEDLAAIEAVFGLALPRAYRTFLTEMGRDAGTFLRGTDFLYPDLLTLREQAERLLQECGAEQVLDRTDLVFAVHQGYQFLFLRCGASDDPEVFHYVEGDGDSKRVFSSFSEWLASCVKDEINAATNLCAK